MKTYRFTVHNWKSGMPAFWVYKQFRSSYDADRWATRITFRKPGSMYMVALIPD